MPAWRFVLLGLSTCLYCVCAAAGDASGRFAVSGGSPGTIAPTHAAAFVVRDQYNPRKTLIEIVLSGAPVDTDAVINAIQPHTNVINQAALSEHDYVLMWLAPDGKLQLNATFRKTMTQYLDQSGASIQVKLDANTPDRVAGHVLSIKPGTTLAGDRYDFDLRFDTAVSRLPPGRALGKGGEAPGKALRDFLAGAKRKHWPAIKAGASPQALKFFEAAYRSDKENAAEALSTLEFWLPKTKLKITGGVARGDIADLEVEGEMHSGVSALHVARMRHVDDKWLFEGAALLGLLP